MFALICDSDITAGKTLSDMLYALKGWETEIFTDEQECISFIDYHGANMIFLSTDSKNIDHRNIIGFIKSRDYRTLICLVSVTAEDSADVYKYYCDQFVQKPYTDDKIKRCLEAFDYLSGRLAEVRVRTFGVFDVFVNDSPIIFHNAKAKELLALCIDRQGASVCCAEAIEALWPDRAFDDKTKRLYRKAVACVNSTLRHYGVPNIFKSFRGGCMANVYSFRCDYYSFMKNPSANLGLLNGKYMTDYDWAENTLAKITRIAQESNKNADLSFMYE